MPTTLAKPPVPIFQPRRAPAGCKSFYALHAKGGTLARDFGPAGVNGAFTGSPAWTNGLFGPELSGFSTSNYVDLTPPSQYLLVTYPCWIAVMCSHSSASVNLVALGGAANGNANGFCCIFLNFASTLDRYSYRAKGDAGSTADAAITGLTGLRDGLPHLYMGVSYTATDHRLYIDGWQRANNATNPGTATIDRLTLGALRTNGSVVDGFPGAIQMAATGAGEVPDPMGLYEDWISGQFSGIRPRQAREALYAGVIPPPPYVAHLLSTLGVGA